MAIGSFKINSVDIKNPSTFKIERYNVTTMERLSNADMVGDLLAKKYKLYFTYDAISATDLNIILEAVWDHDELFFPVTYTENEIPKTIVAYVGSIPTELHRAGRNSDQWIWKNVTFNLIQR